MSSILSVLPSSTVKYAPSILRMSPDTFPQVLRVSPNMLSHHSFSAYEKCLQLYCDHSSPQSCLFHRARRIRGVPVWAESLPWKQNERIRGTDQVWEDCRGGSPLLVCVLVGNRNEQVSLTCMHDPVDGFTHIWRIGQRLPILCLFYSFCLPLSFFCSFPM